MDSDTRAFLVQILDQQEQILRRLAAIEAALKLEKAA